MDFPGSPIVKPSSPSSAEGVGSIPGQGTKIPCATWPQKQNIKQKQSYNKFNKDSRNDPHKKKKTLKKILPISHTSGYTPTFFLPIKISKEFYLLLGVSRLVPSPRKYSGSNPQNYELLLFVFRGNHTQI